MISTGFITQQRMSKKIRKRSEEGPRGIHDMRTNKRVPAIMVDHVLRGHEEERDQVRESWGVRTGFWRECPRVVKCGGLLGRD